MKRKHGHGYGEAETEAKEPIRRTRVPTYSDDAEPEETAHKGGDHGHGQSQNDQP
jgi:hypothetical protein